MQDLPLRKVSMVLEDIVELLANQLELEMPGLRGEDRLLGSNIIILPAVSLCLEAACSLTAPPC